MKKYILLLSIPLLLSAGIKNKFSNFIDMMSNDNSNTITMEDMKADNHKKLINKEGKRFIYTDDIKEVQVKNFIPNKDGIMNTLDKLIKQRKYISAKDMFNNIEIDIPENQYKDYLPQKNNPNHKEHQPLPLTRLELRVLY